MLLLLERGFFFLGQFVVPSVLAQTQLMWKWLGFADADLATLVQEFLNKRVICVFFWDMFHTHVPNQSAVFLSRTIRSKQNLLAQIEV